MVSESARKVAEDAKPERARSSRLSVRRARKAATAGRWSYLRTYGAVRQCVYCGDPLDRNSVDHVPPLSLLVQRPEARGYLVACCRWCNGAIGALDAVCLVERGRRAFAVMRARAVRLGPDLPPVHLGRHQRIAARGVAGVLRSACPCPACRAG